METNYNSQSTVDLETLIRNLKTEDTRNLNMTRRMQRFMWIIAALYVFISAIKFIQNTPWYEKLGGLLVMLAFIVFALLFRSYYKAYKSIDYGLPTIKMLVNASNRYKIFQWRGFSFLIPLVLEDLGLILMLYNLFDSPDLLFRIMIFQIGFSVLLVVGFLIGYLIWKKRQKPLSDLALALLKEIES